jgi:hypothetical protein
MQDESFIGMLRRRWLRLANMSLLLVMVTGLVSILANHRPDVTFEGIALWPHFATDRDDRLIPVVVWERDGHAPVAGVKVTLYQTVGVQEHSSKHHHAPEPYHRDSYPKGSVRMVVERSDRLVEVWSGATDASGVALVALPLPAELFKNVPPHHTRFGQRYTYLVMVLERDGMRELLSQPLSFYGDPEPLGMSFRCMEHPSDLQRRFAQHAMRHTSGWADICVSEDLTDGLERMTRDPAREAWSSLLGVVWLVVALWASWTTARELRREMISFAGVGVVVVMSLLVRWPLSGSFLGEAISRGSALGGVLLCGSLLAVLCGFALARDARRALSPLQLAGACAGLLPFSMVDWLRGGALAWVVVSLLVVLVQAWEQREESGLWRWLGLSSLCAFLGAQIFILMDARYDQAPLPLPALSLCVVGLASLWLCHGCWSLILMHRRRWSAALSVALFLAGMETLLLFSGGPIE